MADSTLTRMDSALRKQQRALAELIDIALHAVRESGDWRALDHHATIRDPYKTQRHAVRARFDTRDMAPGGTVRTA